MANTIIPAADAILDRPFPVLDKGAVVLMGYFGGDKDMAQSARTSYQEGTKTLQDDRDLIDYLVRNRHTSPLEMVVLRFWLKLPLFVFAHIVRHRTAVANAESGRYSVLRDEFYFPTAEELRKQDKKNRQATSLPADFEAAQRAAAMFVERAATSHADYLDMLNGFGRGEEFGIAREQARMILPQNLYVTVVWQINAHNFAHFSGLRREAHAQKETRAYADQMYSLARFVIPMMLDSWEEHVFYSTRLSRTAHVALLDVLENSTVRMSKNADGPLILKPDGLGRNADVVRGAEAFKRITEARLRPGPFRELSGSFFERKGVAHVGAD